MKTLEEIKIEVEKYAALIGTSGFVLPTYGRSEDFARPHIEVDHRGYHYVIVERGQERSRKTTQDLDELLYWIFDSVTSWLATEFEVKHRIPNQDHRVLLFQKKNELLNELNSRWVVRWRREKAALLQDFPANVIFNSAKDRLNKQMRDSGY